MIAALLARWWSERLATLLLRVGARRRSAILVALAWTLATRTLPVAGTGRPSHDGAGGDLLVLDKAGGTEDIIAAAAGRIPADRRVRILSRMHVRTVFKALTGPDVFTTLTDNDYRPGHPAVEDGKARYRAFLIRVLRHYRRWTGITAITTANVRFRSERELAAACTAVGIAFVPLHKESTSTTAQRPWLERGFAELAGPFTGTAIAVYNTEERDSMLRSGFAGEDAVVVVGCPRIDVLHRVREDRRDGVTAPDAPVVLFSVDALAGTWTPFDARASGGAPRWDGLAAATEDAFIAAARRDLDRPYVIKAKIGREDQQVARLPGDLPPNLEVVTGGLATSLIERAAVIVAFNSTVLLEAIAAGVPAIVPRYAEAAAPGADDWTFRLDGAVHVVREPEQLAAALAAAVAQGRSSILTPQGAAALERHVGNPDGRAGERAWMFLSSGMRLSPPAH